MVYRLPRLLERLFLPPSCLLCDAAGQEGLDLCSECRAKLPRNDPCCALCALPLAPDAPAGALCGQCNRDHPPFHRIVAPWRYQEDVARLVRQLKFQRKLPAGRTLGMLLARELAPIERKPELILPVPLHPRQLRERGFNQAAEIARALSRRLDIPWTTRLLRKQRTTAPQHDLNRRARLANLRGAFHYAATADYRHVAVVDDVVTTGATAIEIARTLKRAGVERVEIWAAARTPLD
jgi:ComF family protein